MGIIAPSNLLQDTTGVRKDTLVIKPLTDTTTVLPDTIRTLSQPSSPEKEQVIHTQPLVTSVRKDKKPVKEDNPVKHIDTALFSQPVYHVGSIPHVINQAAGYYQRHYPDSFAAKDTSVFVTTYVQPVKNHSIVFAKDKDERVHSYDWMLLILLGTLGLMAWMRLSYSKFLKDFLQSTFDYQLAFKLWENKSALYQRVSFLLNAISVVGISVFVYFVFDYYNLNLNYPGGFLLWLQISLFIVGWFIAKYLVLSVLGHVFLRQKLVKEYNHHNFIFNKFIGVVLIPVLLLLMYARSVPDVIWIYAGFLVVFGASVIKVFRSFSIIIRKGFSILYMILYLCALEILPVLLIAKFIHDKM